MAPAASMELSDMVNSSIVERPATNSTKFHEFFAHCAPATQEFFPELSGNCDSDSDPGAARRPVSPRRHGGHGDFTEASGFSVPLRVLRVSVVNKVLEFFSMLASRNSRKWGIAPVGA